MPVLSLWQQKRNATLRQHCFKWVCPDGAKWGQRTKYLYYYPSDYIEACKSYPGKSCFTSKSSFLRNPKECFPIMFFQYKLCVKYVKSPTSQNNFLVQFKRNYLSKMCSPSPSPKRGNPTFPYLNKRLCKETKEWQVQLRYRALPSSSKALGSNPSATTGAGKQHNEHTLYTEHHTSRTPILTTMTEKPLSQIPQ